MSARRPNKAATPRGKSVTVAGVTVAPGQREQFQMPVARLSTGADMNMPVTVVNGAAPGPSLLLTAAIHGDEINGVEIAREVLDAVTPAHLKGTLIVASVVNIFGFVNQSRYLPDRRDLNRSFPGSARGSLAARMAHLVMTELVSKCKYAIDYHSAAEQRVNIPQIRGDLNDPETRRLTEAFAAPVMFNAEGLSGTLRSSALKAGVKILLYEGGGTMRFERSTVASGAEGTLRVMTALGMLDASDIIRNLAVARPSIEVGRTSWGRADMSGILRLNTKLGGTVARRQVIGDISDVFGTSVAKVRAPVAGIVIGLTKKPHVTRGEGIVHVGATDLRKSPPKEEQEEEH
ncbi:MAG: succinylglutamate desuccinylase/aspartoacylase family protein [Chloroflexi bacterium]|nr:succinylglutamate desuccinylase/aspartoacylase family protein [Chloroflexota bacterium]